MKKFRFPSCLSAWLATGLALLTAFGPASAQDAQRAWLSRIDTSQFPLVTATLVIHDPAGNFIPGLSPSDITLLENGQFAAVKELSEVPTPVRFSVVINATPAMGIRNAEGKARYELIAQALTAWAGGAGAATGDDYGLFTNGGQAMTGLESPGKWAEDFQAYQADFRNSKPSLESISSALNRETSLPNSPGLGRVILWITSPPEGNLLKEMPGLGERVQQSGVRVNIWSVSPAAAFNSAGSQALQQIAESSGGSFLAYSGVESFPDVSSFIEPLRGMYQIGFETSLRQAGEASLVAQVQLPEGIITSEAASFTSDIQPPNPMLVSPPVEIVRTCPANAGDPLAALTPTSQTIRVLVEFPDRHPRDLVATRFYVDGKLAGENLKAPFDEFHWDLSLYTEGGKHSLKVEAEDSLGLSRQSLDIPVEVRVVIPPADLGTTLKRNTHYLTWAAIFLAGLALMLVMYFGEKRGLFRPAPKESKVEASLGDPLYQSIAEGEGTPTSLAEGPGKGRRGGHASMAARLVFIDNEGEALPQAAVPLSGREVIFGREPSQASCVLNDASVEAIHARLSLDEHGDYQLSDLNSIAGTWVNYAPVSMEGTTLEHGDIIHVGRVAFRFLLTRPGKTRIPSVIATPEGS